MTVLVMGGNYWGQGKDLVQAKQNFTSIGGNLADGFTIVEFSDGLTFLGVDQLGNYHWKDEQWTEGAEIRHPKATKVASEHRNSYNLGSQC